MSTVELATGNHPGNAHCKLSMLKNAAEPKGFKQKLADQGVSVSALSCHGNPLHPDAKHLGSTTCFRAVGGEGQRRVAAAYCGVELAAEIQI